MAQNYDDCILEGLPVTDPPETLNSLFLSWRDWRLQILFPSEPTIEVKCSLIDQYVKKQSGHGTSTFNGSSVIITSIRKLYLMSILQMKEENQNNKFHVHIYISSTIQNVQFHSGLVLVICFKLPHLNR
jgi:hypothetical protein